MATEKKDWHELISQPACDRTKALKDVFIPMRDGARATFHKIYRDKTHPSYLLLPIIP
jgi:hypothetical protein